MSWFLNKQYVTFKKTHNSFIVHGTSKSQNYDSVIVMYDLVQENKWWFQVSISLFNQFYMGKFMSWYFQN